MAKKTFLRTTLAASLSAALITTTANAELARDSSEVTTGSHVHSGTQHSSLPVTRHQRAVLDGFISADKDADGMLSIEEYRQFALQRLARTGAEPRDNLTAAEMIEVDAEFMVADRDPDRQLSFHEIYVFETFDRPGMFPPKPQTVPQAVSGHWESLTIAEHPPVYHVAPFSAENHRKAITEGGFSAADSNSDGVVSVFEASDFSLLTWTGSVHAFADADANSDALLAPNEYRAFIAAVADAPEQADRPGQFPSGRM